MKYFLSFLGIGFLLYVLVFVFLWIFQEKILFFPSQIDIQTEQKLSENPHFTHLSLQTKDGIQLRGWAKFSTQNTKNIIFFDGNAGDISDVILHFPLENINIFSFHYRGYGQSEGTPGEKQILSDSEEIFDFLSKKYNFLPQNTYIMGRSLGTGVATFLASKKSVAGVILVTPYDSIEALARKRFAVFPVDWILRNRFKSVEFARQKENSALMIIAQKDAIIPYFHSKNLMQAWNGQLKEIIISDANHDNILQFDAVWSAIFEFIQ